MAKQPEQQTDASKIYRVTIDTEKGTIKDIVPGSAADKAGVAPDMKLVAVNGRKWTKEVLRDAIADTKRGGKLELLLDNQDFFRTAKLDYHDGLRYPVLKRDASKPDLVGQILAPHVRS